MSLSVDHNVQFLLAKYIFTSPLRHCEFTGQAVRQLGIFDMPVLICGALVAV